MTEPITNRQNSCYPSVVLKSVGVGCVVFLVAKWGLSKLHRTSSLLQIQAVTISLSGATGLLAGLATYLYVRKEVVPGETPPSVGCAPPSTTESVVPDCAVPSSTPPVVGYAHSRTIESLLPQRGVYPGAVEVFGRHFAEQENQRRGTRCCRFFDGIAGQEIKRSADAGPDVNLSSLSRFGMLFGVKPQPGTSHFIIATVDNEKKQICIHDTVRYTYPTINRNFCDWVFNQFAREGHPFNRDEWQRQMRINKGTPRQTNVWDCAPIYVMMLERFFKGEPYEPGDFAPQKVTDYRAAMRQQLLLSPRFMGDMTCREFAYRQDRERANWRNRLNDPSALARLLRRSKDYHRFLLDGLPETDPLYPHLKK